MIKEPQLNEEYFSNDHLPVKSKPKFNEKHRLMVFYFWNLEKLIPLNSWENYLQDQFLEKMKSSKK